MVKIQMEVDGYRRVDGEGIHINWITRAIISIGVIRVQSVPDRCLVVISVPDWGWLVAKVSTSRGGGVLPNSDPFGKTEKGGRWGGGGGVLNWTFFMDAKNVWFLRIV